MPHPLRVIAVLAGATVFLLFLLSAAGTFLEVPAGMFSLVGSLGNAPGTYLGFLAVVLLR